MHSLHRRESPIGSNLLCLWLLKSQKQNPQAALRLVRSGRALSCPVLTNLLTMAHFLTAIKWDPCPLDDFLSCRHALIFVPEVVVSFHREVWQQESWSPINQMQFKTHSSSHTLSQPYRGLHWTRPCLLLPKHSTASWSKDGSLVTRHLDLAIGK